MNAVELDRLEKLIPEARWRVERVIMSMRVSGYDLYIGRTLGTKEDIAKAVAAGRAAAGMTRDWHELGRAVDLRLRNEKGGPDWDTSPASYPFWRALYVDATALGLRCLGYRPDGSRLLIKTKRGSTWDPGHCEYRAPFATLAEAVADFDSKQ